MADGEIRECGDCQNEMPFSRLSCPHCGRPSFFPNVDKATTKEETAKLAQRLKEVSHKCKQNGSEAIAQKFLDACKQSSAVFSCPVLKLHREIASGTDLFETYYDLERLKLRSQVPSDFDWAKLRPKAEIELLGTHKNIDQIHYACLSLDGKGLGYGDCLVKLCESMIAHRSSCFEGNTAVIYAIQEHFNNILRSDWQNRHSICCATFGNKLDSRSTEADFQSILVNRGESSEDDSFIEVHVFGPMTARTFESVHITTAKHGRRETVLVDAIADKLEAMKIQVVRS